MYDPAEQDDVLARFTEELQKATKDGGRKRAANSKPEWWRDPDHFDAAERHLERWLFDGETVDADSGAHPLVHAAWRLLAIACRETGNVPQPRPPYKCRDCLVSSGLNNSDDWCSECWEQEC
jgi:hypothetical protein